jgi:pimeloyl-ACP methyl ester carboxylesterase
MTVSPYRRNPRPPPGARTLLTALLAAATLGGCALTHRYDMTRIHSVAAARPDRHPVIFLHGFIGAKLRNDRTEESVWGRFANAILRSHVDDLSLPIDAATLKDDRDHLVPYALYEEVGGVKFYGAIIQALEDTGGYHLGDIDDPKPGDNAFVYVYDWRRDNAESAAGLARAIERIRTRMGEPELRFDLIAHSMGGLVSLYYLMYGGADVLSSDPPTEVPWAGASSLDRVVLLGTPVHGTLAAFRLLNTGFSRSMTPEVVFTMPSVYELLPWDGEEHLLDPEGQRLRVDLYDAREWVRHGWSVFDGRCRENGAGEPADALHAARVAFLERALDRAKRFHAALQRAEGRTPPVPIVAFGSDCVPTLDQAVMKETGSGSVTLFDGEATRDRNARLLERLMMVPGDGTVSAASLQGFGASPFFVCTTHGFLPANREFQDNLFHVLFQEPTPLVERPPVREGSAAGQ